MSGYSDLSSRLTRASSSLDAAAQRLWAQWQDTAGRQAQQRVANVSEGLSAQTRALEQQSGAATRVTELANLAKRNADAVDRLVGESRAAADEARRRLDEAFVAGEEAASHSSTSSALQREALALVGRAGAGGPLLGGLEARVHQGVTREVQLKVAGMVAKAAATTLAVETAWWAGEQIVSHRLRIPDGSVPVHLTEDLRAQLETSAPVLLPHLRVFVGNVRDRVWR